MKTSHPEVTVSCSYSGLAALFFQQDSGWWAFFLLRNFILNSLILFVHRGWPGNNSHFRHQNISMYINKHYCKKCILFGKLAYTCRQLWVLNDWGRPWCWNETQTHTHHHCQSNYSSNWNWRLIQVEDYQLSLKTHLPIPPQRNVVIFNHKTALYVCVHRMQTCPGVYI